MEWIFILITIAFGFFLHYTYKLSNCNDFVAYFSAVNESTWEHLKLAYFPILILGIIEYFLCGDQNNFIFSKFIAILFSMVFIISFFYTYTGILGKNLFYIDIGIYIISIILSEILSYYIRSISILGLELYGLINIIIIGILFFYFTSYPPRINLFMDPINKSFGKRC